jgi:hypothetical protein
MTLNKSGFFLLPVVLSGLGGYGFLSLKAKRSLSTSEILHYAGIVASNTVSAVLLHRNGSGFKTFGIIADAISDHAIAQTTLAGGQEKQVLPLPPQTILALAIAYTTTMLHFMVRLFSESSRWFQHPTTT